MQSVQLVILLAGVALVLTVFPTQAAVISVPDDLPAIQVAIDAAVSGDTVLVKEGVYYENIVMKDGITLLGEEAAVTILDGRGKGPVIRGHHLTSGEISRFTIQNGYALSGGGISLGGVTGAVTIRNNIIIHNTATFSGGIGGELGRSVIENNVIRHNTGWNGGGGILCTSSSNPTIINNIIVNNVAHTGGGISVEAGGAVHTSYNDIWGNSSDYGGEASAGIGDLSADPLFVDPEHGDFHLQTGSPCIDAGDPSILDPDRSRSDIGAYGGPGGMECVRVMLPGPMDTDELETSEGERTVNLALNKPISTTIPQYENYDLSLAVDGDTTTYFWGQYPKADQHIRVDLGQIYEVHKIVILQASTRYRPRPEDYVRNGELHYSRDGVHWKYLTAMHRKRVIATFPSVPMRYFRIYVSSDQPNFVQVLEMEAYSPRRN